MGELRVGGLKVKEIRTEEDGTITIVAEDDLGAEWVLTNCVPTGYSKEPDPLVTDIPIKFVAGLGADHSL